jgi:hypothetical protein
MFGRVVLEVFECDMMSVMIIVTLCEFIELVLEIFHVSCMFAEFLHRSLCLVKVDSSRMVVIVSIEDVMKFIERNRVIFVDRMMFGREVLEVFECDVMSVVIIVMLCEFIEFVFEVFDVARMFAEIADGSLCLIEVDSSGLIVIVRVENRFQLIERDRMILVNRMMFGREMLEVFECDVVCVMIAVSRCQLVEFVRKVFHVSRMGSEFGDGRLRLIESDTLAIIVIVFVEYRFQLFEGDCAILRFWHVECSSRGLTG